MSSNNRRSTTTTTTSGSDHHNHHRRQQQQHQNRSHHPSTTNNNHPHHQQQQRQQPQQQQQQASTSRAAPPTRLPHVREPSTTRARSKAPAAERDNSNNNNNPNSSSSLPEATYNHRRRQRRRRSSSTSRRSSTTLSLPPINRDYRIFHAVMEREESVVRNLVKETPSILNTKYKNRWEKALDGMTPLMMALKSRNESLVVHMIRHGANVNARNQNNGLTVIHYAIRYNNSDRIIKLLIDKGCRVNVLNKDGYSPLHIAAAADKPRSVELLLKAGVRVNTRNPQNYDTALHMAVTFRRAEMVQFLCNHGADVNARTTSGNTPIHEAIYDLYTIMHYELNLHRHPFRDILLELYDELVPKLHYERMRTVQEIFNMVKHNPHPDIPSELTEPGFEMLHSYVALIHMRLLDHVGTHISPDIRLATDAFTSKLSLAIESTTHRPPAMLKCLAARAAARTMSVVRLRKSKLPRRLKATIRLHKQLHVNKELMGLEKKCFIPAPDIFI